ncbi:Nif3-like dinuclear metal center hexameric protein [Sporosarcina sp. PTS2304]|uniref:Nif3-like dinuclear metal center hexameric protein n=1 Tax=Sporosarcina sp. PTS2304 TaxID=2283194 RepID=UPI000E0D963A|nr:Nif3-like dinuclear metal center hexameric protein [Sporosarcina sp. PTS2304]AXH98990.1 Nif3-like dinuclear metal center hexameric protein [Sporosarcina sp. PTS2304]
MKKANGHQIIEVFESWSPKRLAFEGDPVGLHIGQLNRPVDKVLITLDVNERVIDEAIEQGATLIIAHHPPLFRPVKTIWTDSPQGKMIEKCIKHDIAVYAAHTNLDIAEGGVNDMLAERLGIMDTEPIEVTDSEHLVKLAVFCPQSEANALRQQLAIAGAGAIGDYTGCSFSSQGIGRFTPVDGANPTIGEVGEATCVEEERIEVVFPESLQSKVLKAMFSAHPYEEPAFDLFKMQQKTNVQGIGRVGYIAESLTLQQFAEHVKQAFGVPALRFVGDPKTLVRKVAVLGGDGNKYISAAKRKGADVLVTGDLYYHVAQDAEALGLAVVDPGHNVEKIMIAGVAEKLSVLCQDKSLDVTCVESKVITEPFQFLV